MKTRVLTEAAGQWLIRFRHARFDRGGVDHPDIVGPDAGVAGLTMLTSASVDCQSSNFLVEIRAHVVNGPTVAIFGPVSVK